MLLKFGAKNFYSFKEGVEISFELGSNKCANILCIKGANGSGKTNALKIPQFFKEFCCNSWNQKPDDEIKVSTYFHNDNQIDLYCKFSIESDTYLYEISLTPKYVVSEKLSRRKKRSTLLFNRERDVVIESTKEFNELKSIKLRSNASIISTSNQYQISVINPVYNFFDRFTSNVTHLGREVMDEDYYRVSKLYHDHPDILAYAISMIRKCDIGIKDIKILKRTAENNKEIFFPVFYHDAVVEDNSLIYYEESSGTRALYRILPLYMYALSIGGVLVMDEFDINFHPHILPFLVEMFDNKKNNPQNAQMIFTTHNTDIMEYMGKYRTILINQARCESFGYRLDEISGDIIRNDRLIAPIYNSGKIGGVPSL